MARRGGRGGSVAVAQLPKSFGHQLRVCLCCRLVKNYDQFRESGWRAITNVLLTAQPPILPEFDCKFGNKIISVADPTRSWDARWLHIGKFVPGCYTLAVAEALPHDLQSICEEEEHVPYVPTKRI